MLYKWLTLATPRVHDICCHVTARNVAMLACCHSYITLFCYQLLFQKLVLQHTNCYILEYCNNINCNITASSHSDTGQILKHHFGKSQSLPIRIGPNWVISIITIFAIVCDIFHYINIKQLLWNVWACILNRKCRWSCHGDGGNAHCYLTRCRGYYRLTAL